MPKKRLTNVSDVDVDAIVRDLTSYETTVMKEIPRISKTRNNIFSQSQLERRKSCWDLNLDKILYSLAIKGLLKQVKPKVWQTTSAGRRVAHHLEYEEFQRRYPFPVVRK